jgi:hypothetical protein
MGKFRNISAIPKARCLYLTNNALFRRSESDKIAYDNATSQKLLLKGSNCDKFLNWKAQSFCFRIKACYCIASLARLFGGEI